MELRRCALWMAFLLLAVAHCSEARHSLQRRSASAEAAYDDFLNDAAGDDETQNDADGGEDEEEPTMNGQIITRPTTYNLKIGQTVRLECSVTPPDPNTVVEWSKNNVKYFLSKTRLAAPARVSIYPNSTDLLISDVQFDDSGAYSCEVLQDDPVSIQHHVLVTEPPRIHFTATNNGNVMEGHDLILTCDATGTPTPSLIWSREGVDGLNERLTEKDGELAGNRLFIKNVKRDYAGRYYCYAMNTAGNSTADIRVTVNGLPRVHVHKTVVNSAVDIEAILQCAAHEEPPLHFLWYKDNVLVDDSSSSMSISTSGSHSNLTVIPHSDQDFGVFKCEVANNYGKHSKNIELVQSPVIEDLDVDGPKLTWVVHSHQPLQEIDLRLKGQDGDAEWRSIQVPVPENDGHRYEITYVVDDKQVLPGKYDAYVNVRNAHSWGQPTGAVPVNVDAQPQSIQHASVFGMAGGAHGVRPTAAAILSTTLMYLLVRML